MVHIKKKKSLNKKRKENTVVLNGEYESYRDTGLLIKQMG